MGGNVQWIMLFAPAPPKHLLLYSYKIIGILRIQLPKVAITCSLLFIIITFLNKLTTIVLLHVPYLLLAIPLAPILCVGVYTGWFESDLIKLIIRTN